MKQNVYSNDSDNRENVTIITMKINWKLNKRLKRLTLIITHHEELKELIMKMKHLADVTTENQECHEKIYKVYSDSQTSLKTVKVMISTKDKTRCQEIEYRCNIKSRIEATEKANNEHVQWSC